MNTMYADTAKIILSPSRFSLTKEERNGVSRKNYRMQKRIDRSDFIAPNIHKKGTVCENSNYKKRAFARNHLYNIGLAMAIKCPIIKAFKNRYRGGSWNK